MDFNFNPPDPEKIEQAVYRLKDAFQRAADAETGAAQPSFQRLSDAFNKLIDDSQSIDLDGGDPMKAIMKLMPTIMDFQSSMSKVRRAGQTNPAAAEAMRELEETLKEEGKGIMDMIGGSLGGLGGFGFPGSQPNAQDNDDDDIAPPVKKPEAPKRPRKPGNGDFKL